MIFRDKEHLFTQPFTVAFCIALGIHFVLFVLFQVTPFKIGVNDTVFPPTRVEADTPSRESVLADVVTIAPTIRGLPSAPVSGPMIVEHPQFLSMRPVEYSKAKSSSADAFTEIENQIYQPTFKPLVHLAKNPLVIVISGILSEQTLISDGTEDKSLENLSLRAEQKVVYSVMVEGTSGKIFWYEPMQPAQEDSLDKFAVSILRDMRFRVSSKAIAMSGEVEMHFRPEEK